MNRVNAKLGFTIIYIVLLFILFGIYSYSQAQAVSKVSGFVVNKTIPPGAIILEGDISKSNDIVVTEKRLPLVVKDEGQIIGKVAKIGFVHDEAIVADKLQEPSGKTREFTIQTNMGDIPHPLENLKVVDVWIDYNPRDYPNRRPEKVAEQVPVKRILNRRTLSISESDDKVPVAVVIETHDENIAQIREYQRRGNIFFTNPYPEVIIP